MTEFVDKLGVEYFTSRWRNTCFFYADEVLSVAYIRDGQVLCVGVEDTSKVVHIPLEYFSGFSILKYPPLGYRRLAANFTNTPLVAYVTREQSYSPGIVKSALGRKMSPLSNRVIELAPRTGAEQLRVAAERVAVSVFNPPKDGPDTLEQLLAGECGSFIPNSSLLIEPSVREQEEGFDVFLRGNQIGSVSHDRRVTASARKARALIEKVVSNV